mgnify:CR=1 FL=1
MYKGIYIGIRVLVALVAFFTVRHLYFTPPPIQGGVGGNVYSSCHAVGTNFDDDLYPLTQDLFDVESTEKIQKYLDGGLSYKIKVNDEIRRNIQRQCDKARHERGIVIVVASILFAVVFLSVPKPQRSGNGARNRETSRGAGQKAVAEGENAVSSAGEEATPLGDKNKANSGGTKESN